MLVIDTNKADRFEPDGHFGGLTVKNILGPGNAEHLTIQLSHGPVGSGANMHSHEDSEQLFYVISGELTILTENGESKVLEPGMAAYLAPREGHATINKGNEDVVSIVITSPHL
jgi:quercetin dioxygenase-like cupin family protein